MIWNGLLLDHARYYLRETAHELRSMPYDALLEANKILDVGPGTDTKMLGGFVGSLTHSLGGQADDLPQVLEYALKIWSKCHRMTEREIKRRRRNAH